MRPPRFAPLMLLFAALPCGAQEGQRAIVLDFTNTSRDRHASVIIPATDALSRELARSGVCEVISRAALERAAKGQHFRSPYSPEDAAALARELDAPLVISGEIKDAYARNHDGMREIQVGLIVRVRDVALEELVNGAAERGTASAPLEDRRPDGLLLMEAAQNAAVHAAARMASQLPVTATVMNTAGNGMVIINHGADSGIRRKQEFVVLRNGLRVGRLRVTAVRPGLSETAVVENTGGIRAEDRAIAVFPDPKLK